MTLEDLVAGAWGDSAADRLSDEREDAAPGSLEALICGAPRSEGADAR